MPTNIKIYDGVKADKSAFTAKKFLFRCSSSVSVSFEGRRKRILSYLRDKGNFYCADDLGWINK